MISILPQDISTAKLHGYLLGSIAPRPIAFASTIDEDGNVIAQTDDEFYEYI